MLHDIARRVAFVWAFALGRHPDIKVAYEAVATVSLLHSVDTIGVLVAWLHRIVTPQAATDVRGVEQVSRRKRSLCSTVRFV